jgi:hypothetical protein
MRRLAWAALMVCALAVTAAFAQSPPGLTITRTPGMWELRDGQGTPIKDAAGVWPRKPTLDECEAAGVRILGPRAIADELFRCTTAVRFTVRGICDASNTKPEPPRPVDGEGYMVLEAMPEPVLCPDGISFEILERRWVTAFPTCGEYRNVTWLACGAEHAEPRPETPTPQDPNAEPGPWIEGLDYPVGAPCPPEAKGNCYKPPTK